jgi:putative peptidoglycan lipid II flippase
MGTSGTLEAQSCAREHSSSESLSEGLGRKTFVTTISASLGVVTSIILDGLVLGVFGFGLTTDAYFVASTIPTVITTVMALQASRVVQPIFIAAKEEADQDGWRFLNLIITSGTMVTILIGAGGALVSTVLVRIQAPGFDAVSVALGSALSAWFFLALPLNFPIAVMRVALNSVGEFGVAGAVKFVDNIFRLLCVVALARYVGIFALALGMVAGAVFQIGLFYV